MPSAERVYFIGGVGTYDNPQYNLKFVRHEIRQMRKLLTSLGFREGAPELADRAEVEPDDLIVAMSQWTINRHKANMAADGLDAAPPLVLIYMTGHGHWPDHSANDWYVTGREFDPDLHKGRRSPADLIEPFVHWPDEVGEVLLTLDSCMSELGSKAAMHRVSESWGDKAKNLGLWIVSSSRTEQLAAQKVFVEQLQKAMETTPQNAETVAVDDLVQRINARLSQEQKATSWSTPRTGSGRVLPNPAFMPMGPPDWLHGEWARWNAPARGLTSAEQGGWFFCGRGDVLVDLVSVFDPLEARVLPHLVVGSAGTGKSALLGRLVLAGMPDAALPAIARRGHLPPDSSVHVGLRMQATWSVGDVVERMAMQLGLTAESADELVSAVARSPHPVGVVLDDVDRSAAPDELSAQLLRPLLETGVLRMVLSARQPADLDVGEVQVVDLDVAHLARDQELVDYLVLRATRPPSAPWANRAGTARSVARWAAPQCAGNFGVAATIANQLASSQTSERWAGGPGTDRQALLAKLVFDLFDRAVSDAAPDVEDVVDPLRLAGDKWLPETLWVALASSFGHQERTTAEIDAVIRAAGPFLDTRVVNGERCWRLRNTPPELDWSPGNVSRLLMRALPAAEERNKWVNAHPLLARLLTHWAARTENGLRDLLSDRDFIVTFPPQPVEEDFWRLSQRTRELFALWQQLHGKGMDARSRHVLLTILSGWSGLDVPYGDDASGTVRTCWSTTLSESSGGITHLAVSGDIAVTGHDDGTARLWSLRDTGPVELAAQAGTTIISAVALAPVSLGMAAVARHHGSISTLSPHASEETEFYELDGVSIDSMAFVDATTVVLPENHGLTMLDVRTGLPRKSWRFARLRLSKVAVASGARPLVVIGTENGDVLLRDHTQQALLGVLNRSDHRVAALVASPRGTAVAVVGAGGTVTVHDLHKGTITAKVDADDVSHVALGEGWLVLARRGRPAGLTVYDLADVAHPFLDLVLPIPVAGAAFRDDSTVLLASCDGMTQLTLSRNR